MCYCKIVLHSEPCWNWNPNNKGGYVQLGSFRIIAQLSKLAKACKLPRE